MFPLHGLNSSCRLVQKFQQHLFYVTKYLLTLMSQIEGYTNLLIFRKFPTYSNFFSIYVSVSLCMFVRTQSVYSISKSRNLASAFKNFGPFMECSFNAHFEGVFYKKIQVLGK